MSPFLLTLLLGFSTLIIYLIAVFLTRWWKLRNFPGPLALPIVGNLYDAQARIFVRYLTNARKKYGKFFVFWRGNSPILVVSDANTVRQILTDTKVFVKGTDYTEKFSIVFGKGLVTSIGEKHKHDRSVLSKYFIRTSIEKRLSVFNNHTKEMIGSVIEPSNGKPLALQDFFHLLTLQVFGEHALTRDYCKDKELAHFINDKVAWGSFTMGKYIISGIPFSLWNFFPEIRRLKVYLYQIRAHFNEMIDERMKKMASGENDVDDCLTALIESQTSRQDMHEQLTTLIAAGHDTTAYFGCYMAYLLAHNPKIQMKLKEEIKKVMGERTEVTAEDINNLVYLKKVMQETLRLYTVIPFVTRETTQDITFKEANVTIHKGTTVMIPFFLMHRDPEVWENPSEFIPERFDEIEGISSAKHGYLPFGYGPRTCIGNQLAYIEGAVMFTQILQNYTFFPSPNFKPQIISGISLVSKNGVELILKKDSDLAVPVNP